MKRLATTIALLINLHAASQNCSVSVSSNDASCTTCCDGSSTATATGTPPFTYQWQPGGQTTPTVTGLCPGTYTVCITDVQGCFVCDPLVVIGVTPSGIQTAQNTLFFEVSPNPAMGYLRVLYRTSRSSGINISILNLLGQQLFSESMTQASSFNKYMELSAFPAGIYFLKITTGTHSSSRKFIKR